MRIILLAQTSGVADLQRQRPRIESLLRLPGVAGFSLRIPAKVANPGPGDWGPLDELVRLAGEIAVACGNKEVQFRMMFGRHLGFHAAARMVLYNGPRLGGTDAGMTGFYYPLPFAEDGGPEWVFKRYRRRAQNRLVEASDDLRAAGVPVSVVHGSWCSGTWAEPFIVDHMKQFPGYSLETVVDENVATVLEFAEKWDGTVEFAMSGHWPTDREDKAYATGALSAAIRSVGITNRNDLRNPGHTNYGTISATAPFGGQSYSSQARNGVSGYMHNGQWVNYDWPAIFDALAPKQIIYYEAYPGNFDQSFRAEIARRYGEFTEAA